MTNYQWHWKICSSSLGISSYYQHFPAVLSQQNMHCFCPHLRLIDFVLSSVVSFTWLTAVQFSAGQHKPISRTTCSKGVLLLRKQCTCDIRGGYWQYQNSRIPIQIDSFKICHANSKRLKKNATFDFMTLGREIQNLFTVDGAEQRFCYIINCIFLKSFVVRINDASQNS